jgi:hypothetical protein
MLSTRSSILSPILLITLLAKHYKVDHSNILGEKGKVMKTPFKVGKTYKTQDGADVLIIYIDEDLVYPIVGVITANNGLKTVSYWRLNGISCQTNSPFLDLVTPKALVKTLYVNLHRHNNGRFSGFVYEELMNAVLASQHSLETFYKTLPFSFEVPDE